MTGAKKGAGMPPRQVMVVADPTRESAAALEYALRHAVIENDILILLHVENPNAWKNPFNTMFNRSATMSNTGSISGNSFSFKGVVNAPPEIDFMETMIHASEMAQPNVKVVAERVEMNGKDKASVILACSMDRKIDTLVIGQRRNLSSAILGPRKTGLSLMRGHDTAEFLIENSKCTCVGVQKKGQTAGYVLNSKTHKNFWLLA